MPSLQVAIDPERRTDQDARRVAQNLEQIAGAAAKLASQLATTDAQVSRFGQSFSRAESGLFVPSQLSEIARGHEAVGQATGRTVIAVDKLKISGAAAALALLDIGRAAQRLSDGTATLTDLAFAGTQATQAITLLNTAFGLSPLKSVAIVAGTAAGAYALLTLRTNELSAAQKHAADQAERLKRALETGEGGIGAFREGLQFQRVGASLGDFEVQISALQQQRSAILEILAASEGPGGVGFDLPIEAEKLLPGRSRRA